MFRRILRTLMWRHWLSRKRKIICTILELIFPVFMLFAVYYMRNDIISLDFVSLSESKSLLWEDIVVERRSTSSSKIMAYIFLSLVLYVACDLGVIPVFYGFMSRALIERASGVQELMKMMGVTTSALHVSHVLNACVPGLVYAAGGAIILKMGPNAMLEKSNGFLMFLALFLHFFSLISVGMVFSYLGSKAPDMTVMVIAAYIVLTMPEFLNAPDMTVTVIAAYIVLTMPAFFLFATLITSPAAVYSCGLVLAMPLVWTLKQACILEALGEGLTFQTMTKSHISDSGPVLIAFVYFIVQIALCWLLVWYFEHVIAGVYGSALPWNFLCQKSYWRKTPEPSVETEATQYQDPQYFEPSPANLEAGIKVKNVSKDYPNNAGVLDKLSLDVYKGEITVLLGHNGAGKSTLISVITGMTSATKGQVLVNGLDIKTQKQKARSHIGLCPQQNMFLEYVTVKEHAMFFMLLKTGTMAEARTSAEKLLEKLNIRDKENNQTSQLSGGMKRRVQLACALAGKASVVLLDEPTSGLDVETRRSLWNLLLSLRGSRTVLLSTHFMEEADALGDRVVVLQAGHLRCHATPMYLKRAVGTGYRLTFTTTDKPNEQAITSAINAVIPEATVTETGFNSISYGLPMNTKHFARLFTKLEGEKSKLGIETMGVGVSTLEEVFLKLCSGYDVKFGKNFKNRAVATYEKLTGMPLRIMQFRALIIRYLRFMWRHKVSQIGFGIIVIVVFIFLSTYMANDEHSSDAKTLRAMNNFMVNVSSEANISSENGTTTESWIAEINYTGDEFINKSGASMDKKGKRVHTTFAQSNPRRQTDITMKSPKSTMQAALWSMLIVFLLVTGVLCMMTLPCKEYNSGARLNHILAGCPPELHWGAKFTAAGIQIFLTYVLAIIIACTTLDTENTLTDGNFTIAIGVVALLGCLAVVSFSYYVTFHSSESIALTKVIVINIFFTFIFPLIMSFVKVTCLMKLAEVIVPQYTLLKAVVTSVNAARTNALCKLNKHLCPATDSLSPYFKDGKCCGKISNPIAFFSVQEVAPGEDMLYFLIQIMLYMSLVCLKQRGMISTMWEKVMNRGYEEPTPKYNDVMVRKEQTYVKEALGMPMKERPDIMLVSNLHKNYKTCFCFNIFNAVKGVSFSVKKGECFGLLGVNGAGKSSVFQMLTTNQSVTRGQIFANGHYLKVPCNDKYLQSLSYCPQFRGLDDFLTGRQNINLMLTLNGLGKRDAYNETMTWIRLVDLVKYKNRLVTQYSGGCLRRITAAAALCTSTPLTLLDEPTAGVDVAARRTVWHALKLGLTQQRAIIITSHSLDEMEALCHRIAIMVAGEICALGSPAALRAGYAVGHSVVFKLKHLADTDEVVAKQKIDALKAAIQSKFKCTLKDEHKILLTYHIDEMMPYSLLFADMEALQSSFPELIEDYSVSETTLEEVFLSFAKRQEEPKPAKKKVEIKEQSEQKT